MKGYLKIAGIALLAYAACDIVQSSFMRVPVIGKYLPGGGDRYAG